MIITLTGAYRNVGDHLIHDRAKGLLQRLVDPSIININRARIDDAAYRLMKTARAVILCGGPAYQQKIYPNIYPLNLDKVPTRVIALGLGWKGALGQTPTAFQFSEQSRQFVEHIHNGEQSSCRDYLTVEVLRQININNVVMTGCPAWYDLERLNHDFEVNEPVRIVVSDPAKVTDSSFELLRMLGKKFPGSELVLALHHGYYPRLSKAGIRFAFDHLRLAARATACGFNVRSLAANLPSMKTLYENCDLHIGFRVHAHIFCLSRRTPSLLISEDSRGVGQSMALGGTIFKSNDENLISSINEHIELLLDQKADYFASSLNQMRNGFNAMEGFLRAI